MMSTDDVLLNLIRALRRSGMRISVSESLDAIKAVRCLGYDDRETLKQALAVTLAKTGGEKGIFQTCFDHFFSLQETDFPDSSDPDDGIPPKQIRLAPLTRQMLSGDRGAMAVGMEASAQEADITGIRFFTQQGLFIQRILKGMGLSDLDRDIQRLSKQTDAPSKETAARLRQGRDRLVEVVKDFVERQYGLYTKSVQADILEKYLRKIRLSNLEKRDYEIMKGMIRRMVKRLEDLHSRRRKVSRRGVLDVKKTLRAGFAYQGVLFDTKWKAKKIDRPEIVAICDVSRSVEAVSRFMLLFLYSLNETIAKIRSFLFCSNLVEVSHIFGDYPVDQAMEALEQGPRLGLLMARTDYGQVFREFKDRGLPGLGRKTTVIILGDARTNYGNPEAGILELIRDRSKRIIWLNPEPPQFWGTGDSEMKKYLPYCFFARECSTIVHLERVVDFLLRTRDR